MDRGIFAAHSGWRMLVLLAVALTIGFGLWGLLSSQKWRRSGRTLMLATTIIVDIQILLGIVLYIMRNYWQFPVLGSRIIHPLMMFLALFGIHAVYSRVKKEGPARDRYRLMALGTLAVLVLILLGIVALGGAGRIFQMTRLG